VRALNVTDSDPQPGDRKAAEEEEEGEAAAQGAEGVEEEGVEADPAERSARRQQR
jgi:hypothetical protein